MSYLVIDSHRENSEFYLCINQHLNGVVVLGEGEEAIDYMRSYPVKAVFIQYQLLDMNGTKLASYIKKNYSTQVFIICESSSLEKWKEVTAARATYLQYPMDINRLLAILNIEEATDHNNDIMNDCSSFEDVSSDKRDEKVGQETDPEMVSTLTDFEDTDPMSEKEMISNQDTFQAKPIEKNHLVEEGAKLKSSKHINSSRRQHKKNSKLLIQERSCKIVSVFSPKGGVGKTTTAANLAAFMKTELEMRTVILEFTRQTGNILGHFDVVPSIDISYWIKSKRLPTEDEIEEYLVWCPVTDIAILPTQNLINEDKNKVKIKPEDVESIVSVLEPHFDVIIIDAGTILDDVLYHILNLSDIQLMISKIERETLQDCHYVYPILDSRRIGTDRLIHVLNQAKNGLGAGFSPKEALLMVGGQQSHIINYDKDIERIANEKEPYLIRNKKRGKYFNDIWSLASMVFPEHPEFEEVQDSWLKKLRIIK